MKNTFYAFVLVVCFSTSSLAQFISIGSQTTTYQEDFNTLSTTGTNLSLLPNGWWINETTTATPSANNYAYNAGDGTSNAGNTYSFGTGTNTDRALGSIASGSNASNFGVRYINNSGSSFSSFSINLIMEQWRAGGARVVPDTLYFFYAVNGNNEGAGFVNTTTSAWLRFPAGDMTSKVINVAAAGLDGNSSNNRQAYSFQVTGVNVNPGDTLYLRWRDPNVLGNDDGLAIDSFSFVASTAPIISGPAPISSLLFTSQTKSTAHISFTKPSSYVDSSMSILVFAKPNAAITQGTPTFGVNAYSANSDLQVNNGTIYQNDTAARCVYKGDSSSFSLTGLIPNTAYHLLAYVVNDADSLYSTATIVNGQSSAQPAAPTQLQLTAISQNSIAVKLSHPVGYTDSTFSTLVWVKADSAIVATPILVDGSYAANTDFTNSTGRLENDSNARCVWNADGDSLTITGLQAQTTYHVAAFTFRNLDSTYSVAVNGNQTTFGLVSPPTNVSNLRFQLPIQQTELTVLWDKPLNYVDSTHSILVFAKANTAINSGGNTRFPNTYNPSTQFGAGSIYENDSQAFCIYNGDNNIVDLTSLSPQTTYYLNFWVVNDSVPMYSAAVTAFTQTAALPPPAVTNVLIAGISETSVRINWTKPAGIPNATHTTLVYLKQGSINASLLPLGSAGITASTIFGNGSRLPSDSFAFCIYKGDTNGLTVTGLQSQTAYEAIVFVQRDADSLNNNSAVAIGNGTTNGPPPLYSIGQINTTNPTTGNPDSLGIKVVVEGTIIGFNQRFTGLQFLLTDSTGGITAFNGSRNFGYTVKEGNKVRLTGTVGTFRGLNQIVVDTLVALDTTIQFLAATQQVSVLSEATENKLIWIDSVSLISSIPSGNWPTNSTNILTRTTAGDTITLRLISTSPLAGKPIPTTSFFKLGGIGLQFSSSTSAPFTFNGYQLAPRGEFDIIAIPDPIDSLSAFGLVLPANNDSIILTNQNIDDSAVFIWEASIPTSTLALPTYLFELDTVNGGFNSPLISITTSDTFTSITHANLITLLNNIGVGESEMYAGRWRVRAESGSIIRFATDTFSVSITNRLFNSLSEIEASRISVYPNPASTKITVTGIVVAQLQLLDATGKLVVSSIGNQLPIVGIAPGLYTVIVETANGNIAKKLIIE